MERCLRQQNILSRKMHKILGADISFLPELESARGEVLG
jgi:hypothetical protein